MLTIGFTNHYFTLWNVTSYERKGIYGERYLDIHYNYCQNLSMVEAEAIAKVEARTDIYEIDLSLRGMNGSFWTKRMIKDFDSWRFSFGKLTGSDMRTCTDVWQLRRAMQAESSGRRRVWARRRLLELGELLKFSWTKEQKVYDFDTIVYENGDPTNPFTMQTVKLNYGSPKQLEWWLAKQAIAVLQDGHHFTPGEKVVVEVKLLSEFHFDGMYGTTYIQTFATADGKKVKYKGGTPQDISKEEYVKIKGTVKHDSYKGVNETYLQRIKILAK